MLIIALSVAGCAGYFSVWGLSQLFAGASTAVIIMATVLEIGKVVTTTALHRYWDRLAKSLRIYLTISVAVLMLITSAGIYGFLSNAYQKTANKLEIHEGELGVLAGKRELFEKNIADNEKIIITKNKRIDQLTNLRTTQENRLDSAKTNKGKDKVRSDISLATLELQKLSGDIDGINTKNAVLSDSVSKYNVKALELKAGSEVAGEVGPLKYIAELTGLPMGRVVNYLILLLIFVFDPLAIALILMTNRVFQLEGDTNPLIVKKNAPVIEIGGLNPRTISQPTPEAIESAKIELDRDIEKELTDAIKEYNPEDDMIDDDNDDVVNEDFADEWREKFEALEKKKEENIEPIIEEITIPTAQATEDSVTTSPVLEVPIYKKEPVVTTGKIEVEDIKEIKENRGYSVKIPQPKGNNTIERIGDSNKLFFKRK